MVVILADTPAAFADAVGVVAVNHPRESQSGVWQYVGGEQ